MKSVDDAITHLKEMAARLESCGEELFRHGEGYCHRHADGSADMLESDCIFAALREAGGDANPPNIALAKPHEKLPQV